MKKLVLSAFALSFSAMLVAQQQSVDPVKVAPENNIAVPNYKVATTGLENVQQNSVATQKPTHLTHTKAVTEVVVAETFYDLESNSSVQNRLVRHADGTTSAACTWSNETATFTDRGTGYNYEDAAGNWGAFPTARIETQRVGWPSMMTTTGGTETVISHAGAGGFVMNQRIPKGTGAWTESIVPTSTGHWMLWPRACTGGADGNSIHLIGITAPVGNGGTPYNGLDGALLYWRSIDQGATWDIFDLQLPSLDSVLLNGFRADAYTIVSEGDVVAAAFFNQWGDMFLLKSTDNGSNWTATTINDFPIDNFVVDTGSDWDNDGIYDTIQTCDEAGALILDNAGDAHVFYGNMMVLDADLTDANTSYFPGTNGLMYWNETMGAGQAQMIAQAEDVDQDGQLNWAGDYALYYTSLAGFPSAGKNADGTIFLSYSSYMEMFDNGSQNYRHIHLMKSNDNGATWGNAEDVTPDPLLDGFECVFGSMAPMVDDKIRVLYMRDYEPGLSVRGDMDFAGVNEMIYLCSDTSLTTGINSPDAIDNVSLNLYPNPAENEVSVSFTLTDEAKINVKVYDFLGQEVQTITEGSLPRGQQILNVDLNGLAGGVYFVALEMNGQRSTAKLVVQ